jgi:hypothetical protein
MTIISLITIIGVIITIVLVKGVNKRKHLSDDVLSSFLNLQTTHPNYQCITKHIGKCERCQKRLNNIKYEFHHLVDD